MKAIACALLCCLLPFGGQAKELARHTDAPAFSLPLLSEAGAVSLEDMRGRVIYLDFWASWCTPCRKSFPYLSQLQEKYADDGFRVVAVNLDEDPALAADFLEQYPVPYIVAKGNMALSTEYGVSGLPAAYIINKRGQVEAHILGFTPRHQDYIEAVVEKALSAFSPTETSE